MHLIVYLDIIFIVNFVVDTFVLWITGFIAKKRMKWWRVLLGAFFGAGALVAFVPIGLVQEKQFGLAIYIGISIGAIWICFGNKEKEILILWLLSTTIMLLIGCLMNFFRYFFDISTLVFGKWLLLLLIAIGWMLILRSILYRKLEYLKCTYLVEITQNGKTIVEHLYMDTGNFLWDPVFDKPVILLSNKVVERFVTPEEQDIIRNYQETGHIVYDDNLMGSVQRKDCFHEIIYESVGNPSGKLLCFVVEEIMVHGANRTLIKHPIAIGFDNLFSGKDYQGLLHRECI